MKFFLAALLKMSTLPQTYTCMHHITFLVFFILTLIFLKYPFRFYCFYCLSSSLDSKFYSLLYLLLLQGYLAHSWSSKDKFVEWLNGLPQNWPNSSDRIWGSDLRGSFLCLLRHKLSGLPQSEMQLAHLGLEITCFAVRVSIGLTWGRPGGGDLLKRVPL